MEVRARVAVMVGTLKGVVDGGLFEDPVATAAVLRGVRTDLTRVIVDLEKGPTNEAVAGKVEGGVGA